MLFLHEVLGSQEEAFEAAFRDRLLPALAGTDDALAVRDRWESKLLRTARWSPLF